MVPMYVYHHKFILFFKTVLVPTINPATRCNKSKQMSKDLRKFLLFLSLPAEIAIAKIINQQAYQVAISVEDFPPFVYFLRGIFFAFLSSFSSNLTFLLLSQNFIFYATL